MPDSSSGKSAFDLLRADVDRLKKTQITPEQRLKLEIFDRLPFTIWASTRDFKIVFWNDYCTRNYGFAKEEVLGKDYVDLFVDPLEAERSREDCIDLIDKGKVFRNFLAYDKAKDGSIRTMLTNCFRIYDEPRKAYLQVEVGAEVSDLDLHKDEHRQLRELAERKREEERTILQIVKSEVLTQIGNEYTRRIVPLLGQQKDIEEYRRQLASQGTSAKDIDEASLSRQQQIDYDIAQLTGWNRKLMGDAVNAQNLQELAVVRVDTEKLPR